MGTASSRDRPGLWARADVDDGRRIKRSHQRWLPSIRRLEAISL
jgi:hypothetical protein